VILPKKDHEEKRSWQGSQRKRIGDAKTELTRPWLEPIVALNERIIAKPRFQV
jgi:hypothetical protein